MPRFSYTAYDARGARDRGVIEAETREAAIQSLFRQGRYPSELIEGHAGPTPRWWDRELFVPPGLSHRNLALLTRELATLVKAELAVDEALRIARLQPLMAKRAQLMVARILDRVLEGASLSDALEAQGGAFPPYYAHIVRAGEAAGTLGQALDDLAGFLERAVEFRSRIGSALLYPALLLVAAAGTLLVIMTVLVPTIAPLFQDAGVRPPFVVQVLLDLQGAVATHWLLAMLTMGALVAGLVALTRNERWRLWWDRLLLRAPIVSAVVQSGQTATMTRTLGTLIRNGVPILQALQITAAVLSNRAMATAVRDCASEVKEGGNLASSLGRSGIFPELALRLTAVGEQTGQLDAMLERVGGIYEAALQRQLLRLTNLLTPVLTMVIGVLVGGLLLSVMGAIVGLNDLALR
jgi:general secretion pathway protein F